MFPFNIRGFFGVPLQKNTYAKGNSSDLSKSGMQIRMQLRVMGSFQMQKWLGAKYPG